MVCVTWFSPVLINGDAFYSPQLPSPQVLKALTIQILELNTKPCELKIYCSKEEITKELEINPVVNLRRFLSYCFLLQWIPCDPGWISCWPPANLCISSHVSSDSPATMWVWGLMYPPQDRLSLLGLSVLKSCLKSFTLDRKPEHGHSSSPSVALTTLVSLFKLSSFSDTYENKFKGPTWT